MHKGTMRRAIIAGLALAMAGIALTTSSSSAGAARPLLTATLLDKDGTEAGHVVFKGQGTKVSRVQVHLDAGAVAFGTSDFHGFHIHAVGSCDPTPMGTPPAVFGSAGGHWNPTGATHGAHTGDMPSVLMHANGKADAEFATDRFDVSELLDANGSAVVLHAGRDNFAHIPATYSSGEPPVAGPNTATNNTGDAGGRYACGVVVAT
jgi:Cu-Zn family superoxide dismutase